MSDIYAIHQKAFSGVAAWVILDDAEQLVARVAFTYGKSGLRTTCYFHILGEQMQRAFANGGGYDKASAAASFAAARIAKATPKSDKAHIIGAMATALKDDGNSWDRALSAAGFRVIQAL